MVYHTGRDRRRSIAALNYTHEQHKKEHFTPVQKGTACEGSGGALVYIQCAAPTEKLLSVKRRRERTPKSVF